MKFILSSLSSISLSFLIEHVMSGSRVNNSKTEISRSLLFSLDDLLHDILIYDAR